MQARLRTVEPALLHAADDLARPHHLAHLRRGLHRLIGHPQRRLARTRESHGHHAPAGHRPGERDQPSADGAHRRSGRRAQVDTPVTCRPGARRGIPPARHHRTRRTGRSGHRPAPVRRRIARLAVVRPSVRPHHSRPRPQSDHRDHRDQHGYRGYRGHDGPRRNTRSPSHAGILPRSNRSRRGPRESVDAGPLVEKSVIRRSGAAVRPDLVAGSSGGPVHF